MSKSLWLVDHPYYCSDVNYYAPGNSQPFEGYTSWADFIDAEGDSDLDMNLVFRWDWNAKNYVDFDSDEERAAYDAKYEDTDRVYTLSVFWMGQRKGLFRVSEVDVCRADEPAVREWLTTRWNHLKLIWEPLS